MKQKEQIKKAIKTAVLYLSFAIVCGAILDTAIIKALLAVQLPQKPISCEMATSTPAIATSTIEIIATTTQATIKEIKPLTPRELFEKKTKHLDQSLVAEMAKVIACESNWNPRAKNPNSTAKGIAQFIDKTWKHYCKGDVMSAEDNLDCFVKLYPEHQGWWACSSIVS